MLSLIRSGCNLLRRDGIVGGQGIGSGWASFTEIRTWISDSSQYFLQGIITHPCRNLNGDLVKPPFKLDMND